MRKQSSKIWYRGNQHNEIVYQGHYHDKMYKGSELVWEKLGSQREELQNAYFITVEHIYDNYWSLIKFDYNRVPTYGLAHKMDDGEWVLIKRLGLFGNAKYTLYATSLGFVLQGFTGSGDIDKMAAGPWRYGLNKDIEHAVDDDGNILDTWDIELKLISELTEGDELFSGYDESLECPHDGFTWITKRYKYRYDTIVDQITHETYQKWRLYDWQNNLVSDIDDPSENIPRHKTNAVRSYETRSNRNLVYKLSKNQERIVGDDFLAMMIGAPSHNVPAGCSYPAVFANETAGRYARGSGNAYGNTYQQFQLSSKTNSSDDRIFILAGGFVCFYTDNLYADETNIGVYSMEAGSSLGIIKKVRNLEIGEYDESMAYRARVRTFDNYGLYWTTNNVCYAYLRHDYSDDGQYHKTLFRYDPYDSIRKGFHDMGDYEYPYSFGGIMEYGGRDYIVISKQSDVYYQNKYCFDTVTGLNTHIPVYNM